MVKRLILSLCLGLLAPPAFAGQLYNPFTSRMDLCSTIQESDGSPSNAVCGRLNVPNNSLTDNGDGTYTLSFATLFAPIGSAYVTIGADATLTAERSLTGTANQVIVTDGGANSTVTLSTPQNIHTGASPTFGGLTLTTTTPLSFLYSGSAGFLTSTSAPANGELLIGATGFAPIKNALTGTASEIDVTNGVGTVTIGLVDPLIETKGGTNQTTYTLGDILYSSAANTLTKLAGNTTTTRKFLRQTGTGIVSAAPVWDTLLAADVPGSALTKVDDTNVTLTLGGTPATSLLAATSLTLGWSGQLGLTRGGTNASLVADNGAIVYSDTTKLTLLASTATANKVVMSGASAAPTWSTPTFPNASATSGKLIRSDGTNWIASTPTYPTTATDDNIMLGDGTNYTNAAVPNCTDSGGNHLNYTTATNAFSCGTSGSTHNLLSATHTDTTAASPTRGDLITAQGVSPSWSRLAIGGATTVVHGGTEPAYSAVVEGDLSLSDVTTANVTSTKHGFAPKSPGSANNFLNGAATPAFARVLDSDLSVSDVTTNDATTTAHGFVPKAPGGTTKFWRSDATYAVPQGQFLSRTVKTSGTTYTTPANCTKILVGALGAGGGGGGAGAGAGGGTGTAAGAGGGAGSFGAKVYTVTASTAYTIAIGAGGAGGSTAGGNGAAGGNTTFTDGTTLLTAPGGSGGTGMTNGTGSSFVLGGNGGAVATNGDVNGAGEPGLYGFRLSTSGLGLTAPIAGLGAGTPYGGGGNSRTSVGDGNAGVGFGSGGGGAVQSADVGQTGGAGAGGLLVIWEFSS